MAYQSVMWHYTAATQNMHRVQEKNYNTVYVAITLANNVGF